MNVKNIAHNKQFWRTVIPLFSHNTKSNEKITLVEDETVTTQDEQNAELLNIFFSDELKILKYLQSFAKNIGKIAQVLKKL